MSRGHYTQQLLDAARRNAGGQWAWLARQLGVSVRTMHRWRKSPATISVAHLDALAAIAGLEITLTSATTQTRDC